MESLLKPADMGSAHKMKGFLRLSFELAKAGFKERNEGSFLGVFWYLLAPLLTFGLLLAVFSARLGEGIKHYPLYLLLGLIMFNFFQYVTTESTKAIHIHRGVIKSIRFPLEAIVSSSAFKASFSHFFEIIVFAGFMIFSGLPLKGLFFYVVIFLFFFLFTFGASLILSSLTVYFTDLENIWAFIARLLWFATPIFYTIGGQNRLFIFNLFNPLYYFLTASRDLLLYGRTPELYIILGVILYTLLFLLVGIFIFSCLKRKFAERI